MMTDGLIRVVGLAPEPLDAAAHFHEHYVPEIRQIIAQARDVNVVFLPADHSHHGWRLAAVQELARESAPAARVNGIVGDDQSAITATLDFLAMTPGVAGQLLMLDSAKMENRAEEPI